MESYIKPQIDSWDSKNEILIRLLQQYNELSGSPDSIIHLHTSRNWPPVSNDFFLIKKEYERNNALRKVVWLYQPYVPVLKTINYWISGLEDNDVKYILKNIKFLEWHLFDENFKLNWNVAYRLSDDIDVEVNLLIKVFFLPLVKYIEQQGFSISETKFIDLFLQEIGPYCANWVTKFSTWMNKLWESLINYFAELCQLPKFELVESIDLYASHITHTSDKNDWNLISTELYNKSIKLLLNTKEQIQKHFRKHKKINKEIVSTWLIMLLSKKWPDWYFSQLNNTSNIFKSRLNAESWTYDFESLEQIYSTIDEYIIDMMFFSNIQWYEKSKKNMQWTIQETKHSLLCYISWESMIDLVFEYANKHNLPIVLQKFLRDWTWAYLKYEKNINNYPSIPIAFSSIDTRNLNEFNLFDKNLIFALSYLR